MLLKPYLTIVYTEFIWHKPLIFNRVVMMYKNYNFKYHFEMSFAGDTEYSDANNR